MEPVESKSSARELRVDRQLVSFSVPLRRSGAGVVQRSNTSCSVTADAVTGPLLSDSRRRIMRDSELQLNADSGSFERCQ